MESLFKQLELRARRAAEGSGGKEGAIFGKARFAAGDVEELGKLLGKDSFSGHSRSKTGVVEFASAHGTNPVEDVVFAIGKMAVEPSFEKVL